MRHAFLYRLLVQQRGADARGRAKARLAALSILSAVLAIFTWASASVSAHPSSSNVNRFPPPLAAPVPPRSAPLGVPPAGVPGAGWPSALVPVPTGLPVVGGSWIPEGPAAIQPGQDNAFNSTSSGAIKVKVIVTRGNTVYIGAVNGGIWKTADITASSPNWTPLTDSERSLSIGDLQSDPTDPTGNTLVAGIGRYSSFALFGTVRIRTPGAVIEDTSS